MRPILFHVFGFPIHSYGVMLVIAFLIGIALVRKRAPKFGIDPQKVTDALIIALFIGVLGARIFFIAQELPYYLKHLHQLFSPEFAGLTSFGGLAFGLAWMIYWAKRNKVSTWNMIDCLGPSFLIGTAVGRIGCILNGCCYGGICQSNFPLAIYIPQDGHYHYPAQLIDLGLNLLGMATLLMLEKRSFFKSGQVGASSLIVFGAARFIYEFWRGGTAAQVASGDATSEYLFWKITEAQVAAAVVIAIGFVLYFVLARMQSRQQIATNTGAPKGSVA